MYQMAIHNQRCVYHFRAVQKKRYAEEYSGLLGRAKSREARTNQHQALQAEE